MTSPADPFRPVAPTVREIAALTARLRDISARGREVDPEERAAFLADKDALIARITDAPAHDVATTAEARTGDTANDDWSARARPSDPAAEVITFDQPGYYSDADLAAISDAITAGDTERARQLQDRPWAVATTDAVWPVMPEGMREQAIRAEAELTDRESGAGRRDDPVEIAERIGDLRAEHGPSSAEATITRAEAAEQLTELGHDPVSAQAMVAEYLHETSRAVGVPVYQWGLDGYDVAAIAEQYAWVDDGNGQTLAQARDRADGYEQYWTEQAAVLDTEHQPRETEQVQRLISQWADRARVPEPFTHPATDDGDLTDDDAVIDNGGATDNGVAVDDDSSGGGQVVIPEQDRREQLARWHAEDHTTGEAAATAGSFDGASLDLGRG